MERLGGFPISPRVSWFRVVELSKLGGKEKPVADTSRWLVVPKVLELDGIAIRHIVSEMTMKAVSDFLRNLAKKFDNSLLVYLSVLD